MSNPVLKGSVRDLVQSGEGVVETSEGLFFVRGVIEGESVLIRPSRRGGRVRRAGLLRVTEPSSVRVSPPCPHAGRCGGCPTMHLTLDAQRALKARWLEQALRKAGADVAPELVHAAETLGYRRRARLGFKAGAMQLLGFRREHTREVVDIDRCRVLSPVLDQALEAIRARVLPHLAGEGELGLALGPHGGAVLSLRSEQAQPREAYAACEALVAEGRLDGAALRSGGATVPARMGSPEECAEGADGERLHGTLDGFSQAHAEINRALTARVVALAEADGQRVLELYSGHGNFTVLLAKGAQSLVAVEQDGAALDACRRNLEARGLSAKLVQGDVTRDVARQVGTGPIDVVVLDPPRTGAPGVLPSVAARKPRRIVYVSCDPATLARDLGELNQAPGPRYRVDYAGCFEMFPHTADLESVVRLVRT